MSIELAASLLVDAAKEIARHPSKADDTGSSTRTAKHYMARALNKLQNELSGTQAAAVVLSQDSSFHARHPSYFSAWDYVKMAKAVSHNVDLVSALAIGDDLEIDPAALAGDRAAGAVGGGGAPGGAGGGDEPNGDDGAHGAAADMSDDNDGGDEGAGDMSDGEGASPIGANAPESADRRQPPGAPASENSAPPRAAWEGELDNDDLAELAEILGGAGGDAFDGDAADGGGGGGGVAAGRDRARRAVAQELDLAAGGDGTSRTGRSGIYTHTISRRKIPVSDGVHYALRDYKLGIFNAFEFDMLFKVEPMSDTDRAWRDVELAGGVHPPAAGRRRVRFLLRSPHPLFDSHVLVKKAKWGVPIFAGAPPPRMPRTSSGGDTAARDGGRAVRRTEEKEFAAFFGSIFIPWIAEGDHDTGGSGAGGGGGGGGGGGNDGGVEYDEHLTPRDGRPVIGWAAFEGWLSRLESAARSVECHEDDPSRIDECDDLRIKRSRYRAHARLTLLGNVVRCFRAHVCG